MCGNQVKTINLQTSYDTKLNNATFDALKAFQLNTINSDTSDLENSKLRDIEASVNTFFTSMATNFNMSGYNKDILKDYVPALVYTMYDGYYIYSPYTNTLDQTEDNEVIDASGSTELKSDAEILTGDQTNPLYNENATYHEGEKLSGLKPYIYYSCRYIIGTDNDFVITYSLDNYITIQGKVDGEWESRGGYLLEGITEIEPGRRYSYREVEIENNVDDLQEEYVYNPEINSEESINYTQDQQAERIRKYQYLKVNGVKYYKDGSNWFTILNGTKLPQEQFNPQITPAIAYYQDAYDFTNFVKDKIGNLSTASAYDKEGHQISEFGDYQIFDFNNSSVSIEDPDSNFNQHRLAVIRYCIEKELSIAINNYNNYSGVSANFQMPKLKEEEWDKIINNISIISFLQGLSIGGKIYNGYSIITNNKNKEVVNEDSIYIVTNDGNNRQYHRVDEDGLANNANIKEGILNIDLETKYVTTPEGTNLYYIPKGDSSNPITGSYASIVSMTKAVAPDNFYKYVKSTVTTSTNNTLAQKYFTALARERYGMYRTNADPAELKGKFGVITTSP